VKATRPGEPIFLDTGLKWWMIMANSDRTTLQMSKMVAFTESIIVRLNGQGMSVKYLRSNDAGKRVRLLRALCDLYGITIDFAEQDMP
jgi:hypothetical protein